MNLGILWAIFEIAKKLFNIRIAYISTILFCLIYSNAVIVVGNRTEIPFVFFLLAAFANIKHRWHNVLIAGLLMSIAEWYRPLMPVFIPGLLLYMYYKKFEKKYYVVFFLSLVIGVSCIGLFNKVQTGTFFIHPSTGGANLFMTANDKAYGGTATHLLSDTDVVGTIPKEYNALQRDSVYKELAVNWIKENPVKYSTLYIKKIFGLYIEDSWPDRAIMHSSGKLSIYVTDKDYKNLIGMASLMFLKSFVYYLVIFLFIYSVYKNRRDIISTKGSILITLVLGTLATCIYVVSPTYHYPYMYAIVIWASFGFDTIMKERMEKSDSTKSPM
jgi:hypothetical protein